MSVAVPGAKAVSAALNVLIKVAEGNPAWNPVLHAAPAKVTLLEQVGCERHVRDLERSLLASPPPGMSCEKISELFGYRDLWHRYPELDGRWVLGSSNGPPLVPFVETWANDGARHPSLPVSFVRSGESVYRPPAAALPLAAMAEEPALAKVKRDEAKLRICSASVEHGHLKLEFSASRYTDYIRTNWAVANLPLPDSDRLRDLLCGADRLLPLLDSRCANDLGVSAIVAFNDEIVLPVSSAEVVSSPNMLVPSASGSADFLASYWLGQLPGPAQDILREAQEELDVDAAGFRDASVRLLALTRNVLRGGKPELFYYIHLPIAAPAKPPATFEHQRNRQYVRLPGLLDATSRPFSDFDSRIQDIKDLIRAPSYDQFLISPFARVALHYYVRFAESCSREHRRAGSSTN